MSDVPFPDRVYQLRQRWDADPSSRLFLQLAEEYRHLGRLKEALAVLDAGLKEHPGYLSALVAKGRCHLELGQPGAAREVLERVVRQDATQMVANKLLVRAYLDLGEPARARERLDLYSLLHESDPELDELGRRIEETEAAAARVASAPASIPAAAPPEPGSAPSPAGGDVFDIGPAPARRPAPVEDLFGLYREEAAPEPAQVAPPQAAVPLAAFAVPEEVAVSPLEETAVEPAPEPADEEPEEETQDGAIFPGLATRARRRLWAERLAAEGIFHLDLPAPVASLPPAAAPAPEPAAAEEWPGAFEPAEPEPALPPPFHEDEREPEPALALPEEPALSGETETATATLGELYLRQGHLDEAGRLFREVLRREPGNAAAADGLARLAAAQPVAELPAAPEPVAPAGPAATPSREPASLPATLRSRKVLLLSAYLEKIKRGSERHVP